MQRPHIGVPLTSDADRPGEYSRSRSLPACPPLACEVLQPPSDKDDVMRHKTAFVFVLAASFLAASSVITQAQDQRVHVSLSGGYTAPNSDVRIGSATVTTSTSVSTWINPISIEALYSFNGQFLATTFGVRF
jgi:hypothetical protein